MNVNSTISVSPHNPVSFAENNNVGMVQRLVLVVVNKTIIRSFAACLNDFISSMFLDKFGLMAIACRDHKIIKLFHSNGTYTTKNMVTSVDVLNAQFDSKGRFVMSLTTGLRIYF
jgi:hypothetical protein